MARVAEKTSALTHDLSRHSQPPGSRKALDRRSVLWASSLARHYRCDVLHEALHRLEELAKIAVAVEVDLKGIETRSFAVA